MMEFMKTKIKKFVGLTSPFGSVELIFPLPSIQENQIHLSKEKIFLCKIERKRKQKCIPECSRETNIAY